MRYLFSSIFVILSLASCRERPDLQGGDLESTNSKTRMQCAEGKIAAQSGYRLNLNQNASGEISINFIEGTTVSGAKYSVKKISGPDNDFRGVYDGLRKGHFKVRLNVSNIKASNQYIDGYASDLDIEFEDVRFPNGQSTYKSKMADKFVCGTKIADFGS